MKTYKITDHKIIQGDIIEILKGKEIPDGSIDLIFADPPYNIGKNFNGRKDKWESVEKYMDWCHEWLDLSLKKLKQNGSFYLMASTQFMPYFDIYLRDKINIMSRVVWAYDSSGVQAQKHFGSLYEPILFCVKNKNKYTFNAKAIRVKAKTGADRKLTNYRSNPPKPYNKTKVPGNVWQFNRVRFKMEEYEEHPSQKPRVLLERIVKASTNKKGIVLDLFSGTFTTAIVAKNLSRISISIEIDDEFVKIGMRRLKINSVSKTKRFKGRKKSAPGKRMVKKKK